LGGVLTSSALSKDFLYNVFITTPFKKKLNLVYS